MTTDAKPDAKPKCRWLQFDLRVVGALLLVILVSAIVFGIAAVVIGVRVSIQAEETLHSTIFVVCLVEQFVFNTGRWPTSWDELNGVSLATDAPSPLNGELNVLRIGGQHGYDWPKDASQLRSRVEINFNIDLDHVIEQAPMDFEAIKPIGAYYEYRDYGYVQSLQETLRQARSGLLPLAPMPANPSP